nr:MAG TPA: hypothetical protein [Caudoviricetes sp.]
MTTATHPRCAQRKEPIMTTAPIIPFPGPRHAAPTSNPLGPEPESEASPRHGLYVAFERVGLGWSWRCLRCGADGSGCTDKLALAAAIAHPCDGEEEQA